MRLDKIEVKCYSGHTYAERPESFFWQDKEHKISKIEEEWLEPGKKFFRVTTEGEKPSHLCYNRRLRLKVVYLSIDEEGYYDTRKHQKNM